MRRVLMALLFAASLLTVAACGGQGVGDGEPAAAPPAAPTQSDAAEAKPDAAEAGAEEPDASDAADASEESRVEEEGPKIPTLPELAPADIYLNLEPYPYEFEFDEWFEGERFYSKCGTRTDPDTLADMSVCIYSSSVSNVVWVEADIVALAGDMSAASWFLPYLATVPYDGNDARAAKAWVEENLGNIQQGQPLTAEFGPAVYELSGNGSTALFLEIKPIGLDEWFAENP